MGFFTPPKLGDDEIEGFVIGNDPCDKNAVSVNFLLKLCLD